MKPCGVTCEQIEAHVESELAYDASVANKLALCRCIRWAHTTASAGVIPRAGVVSLDSEQMASLVRATLKLNVCTKKEMATSLGFQVATLLALFNSITVGNNVSEIVMRRFGYTRWQFVQALLKLHDDKLSAALARAQAAV